MEKKYRDAILELSSQCDPAGMCMHGQMLASENRAIESARLIRKSALRGYPAAMGFLGFHLTTGYAGITDIPQGKKWLRKSFAAGDVFGAAWLGEHLFSEGKYLEAFEYVTFAAERGSKIAQSRLGDCYAHGLGCTVNPAEALKWMILGEEDEQEFFAKVPAHLMEQGQELANQWRSAHKA